MRHFESVLFDARDVAVEGKELQLAQMGDIEDYKRQNPFAYYQEFGSLNLDFGRRSGNSYWIASRVLQCEDSGFKVAVLSGTPSQNERMIAQYKAISKKDPSGQAMFLSRDGFVDMIGHKFDYIFVQGASWWKNQPSLKTLMERFSPRLFLLL